MGIVEVDDVGRLTKRNEQPTNELNFAPLLGAAQGARGGSLRCPLCDLFALLGLLALLGLFGVFYALLGLYSFLSSLSFELSLRRP